ncbi:sigma factor-like helix-turn-helix DNA-binding protein [Mesorhizobium sp. P5_C1]
MKDRTQAIIERCARALLRGDPDTAVDLIQYRLEQALRDDEFASSEILSALQQISLERSIALVLVAVGDLSYADTANALKISTGTLMSRIAAGREQLRSILDDAKRPAS